MTHSPNEVISNKIYFQGRVDLATLSHYLPALDNLAMKSRFRNIILDFSKIEGAHCDGILGIICINRNYKNISSLSFSAIPPQNSSLRNFFHRTGWSYYLNIDEHRPVLDRNYLTPLVIAFNGPETLDIAVKYIKEQCIRAKSLDFNISKCIEWVLAELTDNVLNHSEDKRGGLIQCIMANNSIINITVCDAGQGIKNSFSIRYPDLRSDEEAIGKAIEKGGTCDPVKNAGNGLTGSLKIASASNGVFSILTGYSSIRYQDGKVYKYNNERIHAYYQGTLIYFRMDSSKLVNIEKVLGLGAEPHNFVYSIDIKAMDTENNIILNVRNECTTFSSRKGGEGIRKIILNKLSYPEEYKIVLNWDGISMISSSFADEVIGILFKILGPMKFMNRICFVNLDRTVSGLIDKAIGERMGRL